MNKITQILLGLVLAAGLSTPAFGQTAFNVNFNFLNEPGNQVSTPGTTNSAGITGAIVDRGPGLNLHAVGNSISSTGWDSLEDAEDFFSFRFTVEPGFSADITNLVIGTRSSGTGPGSLGLFSSVDNFDTNLHTFTQNGTAFLNSDITLNLTGITGMVEFRIIALSDTRADGGTGISSAGTFRMVNYFSGGDTGGITFSGTVIPEPSTYAMILAGLTFAVVIVRRRFSKKI